LTYYRRTSRELVGALDIKEWSALCAVLDEKYGARLRAASVQLLGTLDKYAPVGELRAGVRFNVLEVDRTATRLVVTVDLGRCLFVSVNIEGAKAVSLVERGGGVLAA
jgi:hypothetical protein